MTDSVKIPQLHLFGHYRPNRSPTKDFIQFESYKLSRSEKKDFLLPPSPYKTKGGSGSVPAPVLIPASKQPIQPLAYQKFIPTGISSEYIRAPSTYIEYAQKYLMGHPLSIVPPIQTGRFNAQKSMQTSRRHNVHTQKWGYRQQRFSQQNISKKVYLNPKTIKYESNKKSIIHELQPQRKKEPKSQPQSPQIITKPITPSPQKKQQSPQNNLIKDPYLLPTQREREPKKQPQPNVNLIKITENQSLYISDLKNKPIPPISRSDEAAQTIQNNNRSQINTQKNKSSDAQSFKAQMKKKMDKFHSIRIDLEDMPSINVQHLVDIKDQYIEQSKDILFRLNQLAGDWVEMSMIQKTKKKGDILWPNIQ